MANQCCIAAIRSGMVMHKAIIIGELPCNLFNGFSRDTGFHSGSTVTKHFQCYVKDPTLPCRGTSDDG